MVIILLLLQKIIFKSTNSSSLVPVYVGTKRNSNNNKPEAEICKISSNPFLVAYLGETSGKLWKKIRWTPQKSIVGYHKSAYCSRKHIWALFTPKNSSLFKRENNLLRKSIESVRISKFSWVNRSPGSYMISSIMAKVLIAQCSILTNREKTKPAQSRINVKSSRRLWFVVEKDQLS